jgi:hypothetical protein
MEQKVALHLTCHQDPVHNVARMDSGVSTALLCLHKICQSPIPIPTRLKASWTTWAWRQKTDMALGPWPPLKITLEEPRVTFQVVGRPQSPTQCCLTFQVSFILHRSPWWGWMVSSTSQKLLAYSHAIYWVFPLPIPSLKHRWSLKPLIDKLLHKGILKPTHSSSNTPILPVLKPNGSYRLVQD